MSDIVPAGNNALLKEDFDPRDLCGYPGEYQAGPISTLEGIEMTSNCGYLEGLIGKQITNVGVVVDRGPLNLRALGGFAELHRTFNVSGVVAPGSELDNEVLDLARRIWGDYGIEYDPLLRPAREEHIWINRRDMQLRAHVATDQPGTDTEVFDVFRFVHESYDIKKLRQPGQAGEIEREEYCDRVILQLLQMNPHVIFLDNYKVFLAPNIVRQFLNRIVNIHPSVLPLNKGFRPEMKAFEGENPEANGYTLHVVDESMDGGPTLFQQQVPVLPLDPDMRARLGEKAYANFREEQARLRIMYAQQRFVPWVLAVYASDLERRIVEGAEAFAYEGRAGFEESVEYADVMDGNDKPYQRMVFRNPAAQIYGGLDEWITLEHLLSAPTMAEVPRAIGGLFEYGFVLPRKNGQPTAWELMTLLQEAGVHPEMYQEQAGDADYISLRALGSCATILANYGVTTIQERMPTHVLAPRKPIKKQEIVMPEPL